MLADNRPVKHPRTKRDLENGKMPAPAFKRVTARGKRYVYLRGTNVALVRGFTGTETELDQILASDDITKAIAARDLSVSSTMIGWRTDAAKLLHKITKSRAQHKRRSYGLSIEQISRMLFDTGDRCEVTGLKLDYRPKTVAAWKSRPMAPSLDRISNRRGYEPDNLRVVCACVNVAINEWGLDNFEMICRAFVEQRAHIEAGIRKQMADLAIRHQ